MSETDVLLLNLEVEAAAARNADLSRRLQRMSEKLGSSSFHAVGRRDLISRGTQTEFDILRDVALNLDDLLFEMAEIMFRLYPSTPIDLSSRKCDGSRRLEDLSNRCLREMHSLRAAWETKLEGYNRFIEDLQEALGTYYRSMEGMECQLREKELECMALVKENGDLSRQCADLETQLKAAHETSESIGKNLSHLLQKTGELETERDQLLKREAVLANTVASLRAECALGPWKNNSKLLKETLLENASDPSNVLSARVNSTPTRGSSGRNPSGCSVDEMVWACQGSVVNKAFPEWCISPEKIVDFSCKMRNSS